MTTKQSLMEAMKAGRKITLTETPDADMTMGAHKFLNVTGTIVEVTTGDFIIERNGKKSWLKIPKASEIVFFDGTRLEVLNPVMGGALVYVLA